MTSPGARCLALHLLLAFSLVFTVSCGEEPAVPPGQDGGTTASATDPGVRSDDSPRNLIFVVVDTLRPDYLGSYGGSVATPFLDELAASGVRFERNYSHAPMTGPSHASMFTAGLPSDHGCLVNSQSLDPENETLAEILSEAGYATAGFISLGVLRSAFGFNQGFDVYSEGFQGRWWKSANEVNENLLSWLPRVSSSQPTFLFLHYSDPHTPYSPPNESYPPVELWRGENVVATLVTNSRPAKISIALQPGVNDFAVASPGTADRESLGWGRVKVHHGEIAIAIAFDNGDELGFRPRPAGTPGVPGLPKTLRLINPTQEPVTVEATVTVRMNLSADDWPLWYAKEVAYVDSQLALAADALRAAGLWDNSVIVFTSDHGEGLGQHGHMQHVDQLYDSLLRVPLIIVAPGRIEAGRVIETFVRHLDLLPTVLDLLDIPSTADRRGSSLLPLIDRSAPPRRPPVVSETHRPEARFDQRSVVYEGYKYIVNDVTDAEELYDLSADPGELTDLADSEPELLQKLRAALDAEFLRSYGPGITQIGWDDLSDEQRAQLEALGYTR